MPITLLPGRTVAGTLSDLAVAYGFTSRLVLAPADDELLAKVTEPGLLGSWPLHRCSETMRGLFSLHQFVAEGESREALATDYERLFVTPPSCIPAPYESAYRPFEHLLLDLPTIDVRDERHIFGLHATGAGNRKGDHIGQELQHAGRLCLAAREASDNGDQALMTQCLDAHHAFLEEHLMRWAPGCLRETEADAETHFYRGAAALALGVLAHAHERLS
jgi:TorA maturation chaperone TorD